MSWQAVTWVLERSNSMLGSRLVLLSIASHANREGRRAWPSLQTLALESRLSRSQVIRCVRALETSGELVVHRDVGRTRTNSYSLPLVADWLGNGRRMEPLVAAEKVAQGAQMVASAVENGRADATRTVLNGPKQEPNIKTRAENHRASGRTLLEEEKEQEDRRKIAARDLRLEREGESRKLARVGQGPACGEARVKPEALERIREREARRKGVAAPT